jgi:NADH-quinone oxidoreductase subunit N
MGFMLLALVGGVADGGRGGMADAWGAAMFYVVTYVLTTLATFGVLLLLTRAGFESEDIEDFAGLNQRSPLYAGVLAACLFSLAGVPPLVGFYAKLAVLQALLASGAEAAVGLAVFAVLASLVGAFYYLRLIKVMYFDAPVQTAPIEAPLATRAVLTVNGALVLVLGVLPGGLMTLCVQALRAVL